jgi:predicted transcriptional regulator
MNEKDFEALLTSVKEADAYITELRASIKRGIEDIVAGRVYTHEQVKRHFDIEK